MSVDLESYIDRIVAEIENVNRELTVEYRRQYVAMNPELVRVQKRRYYEQERIGDLRGRGPRCIHRPIAIAAALASVPSSWAALRSAVI